MISVGKVARPDKIVVIIINIIISKGRKIDVNKIK
jgi:hypothetical protein